MEGIKIYTIDSKKMIKKGLVEWDMNQEQAKTYFSSIEKDNKKYKVKIIDENKRSICVDFYFIRKKNFRY